MQRTAPGATAERSLSELANVLLDYGSVAHGLAAQAIAHQLERLDPARLLAEDREARKHLAACDPEDLQSALASVDEELTWAVAAVFTFHRSGFVRERALQHLSRCGQEATLPFILMRINDWVPAIRARAQAIALERLDTVPASLLFHNLPLINRMRHWQRADHAGLMAEIDRRLSDPAASSARDDALRHPDGVVRRTALMIALRAEPTRGPELVAYAVASRDRMLRRHAVAHLRRLPAAAMLPLAHLFLLDTDGAIRGWAQRAVHEHQPGFDFAEFYRAQLRANTGLRGALFGLGETGSQGDVAAVIPYLSHLLTTIRRASLYALANLDMEGSAHLFVQNLADRRLRVARDSAAWLTRYPHVIAAHREPIMAIAATCEPSDRRRVEAVLRAGDAYRRRWASS